MTSPKSIDYRRGLRIWFVQELYTEFGDNFQHHTIRARLYESEAYREKRIIKTDRGVYALCGVEVEAIVEEFDTKEHVYKLVDAKLTYDLILCDSPYATGGQKGGNRQLTDFSLITPEEFEKIVVEAEKLLKDEYSQFVMMISGGKSSERDVNKYLRVFENTNLKLCNRGSYRKYNANGTVCNMGKFTMPDEQILSYSISGKERPDTNTDKSAEYHFQRPPLPRSGGYSTEKPLGLIKAIIERATKQGERVLDLFTGSGVSVDAALLLGRKIHALEISGSAIQNHILPRLSMHGVFGIFESLETTGTVTAKRQTSLFDFL